MDAPRHYQLTTIASILERAQSPDSFRGLYVGPTGCGKGTISAESLALLAKRGLRVLFVVHRTIIARDIFTRIPWSSKSLWVPGEGRDRRAAICVTTVQSLANANTEPFDVVLVDEAPHYSMNSWSSIVHLSSSKHVFGFSATPERPDGRPLREMFDSAEMITSYTELLGWNQGLNPIIVPMDIIAPNEELDGLAVHPVDAYRRYADGSRCLTYVPRIGLAHKTAKEFCDSGIPAEVIVMDTPDRQRASIVHRLMSGRTKVVVNVNTLSEGVDIPQVETIILGRICAHRSTYVQISNRGTRSCPSTNKTRALLIDLVGASHRHGNPVSDYDLNLDAVLGPPPSPSSSPSPPSPSPSSDSEGGADGDGESSGGNASGGNASGDGSSNDGEGESAKRPEHEALDIRNVELAPVSIPRYEGPPCNFEKFSPDVLSKLHEEMLTLPRVSRAGSVISRVLWG